MFAFIFFAALAIVTVTPSPLGISPECRDRPIDMYFLLDSSSSVWIVDYGKLLEFVVSTVKQFTISSSATRVGLGVFSDNYKHVTDLGSYQSPENLYDLITKTPYLSGNTNTDKGLNGMRTTGFRTDASSRPDVTRIGVLVTDGKSRYRSNTVAEASTARDAGIWLYAIGVGSNLDNDELTAIGSEPKSEFVFRVPNFDALTPLISNLTNSICRIEKPQADDASCGSKKKADIMFVYNSAGMRNRDIMSVRQFIVNVTNDLSMSSGNVRVGVISEGCQRGDITLREHVRRDDFVNSLMALPQPNFSPLLKKLRLYGYEDSNGGRKDSVKIAVVFLDDVLQGREDVMYEALLLKYNNVIMHVIAVQPYFTEEDVKHLSTDASRKTVVRSYEDLVTPQAYRSFKEIFCQYI